MKNVSRVKPERSYFDRVHTWGRISCVVSLLFMLAMPLVISMKLAWPPLQELLKGLAGVLPLFWTVAVIETLSYGPIIGNGGRISRSSRATSRI